MYVLSPQVWEVAAGHEVEVLIAARVKDEEARAALEFEDLYNNFEAFRGSVNTLEYDHISQEHTFRYYHNFC